MKIKTGLLFFSVLVLFTFPAYNLAETAFDSYHSPEQVNKIISELGGHDSAQVHELGKTAGGEALLLLEIGPEAGREKTLPAVLTAANMEGTVPLATEAALYLANSLLENPELYKDKTWYILPCGNPDALSGYFSKPLNQDPRNASPVNDDMDEAVDEDGVEDLNGDGIISLMRVIDPEGEWIQVPGEPRLMKKADPKKGETGKYSLYTEGLDNDRDGQFNEDGPGGTNVGINFPHGYEYWTPDGGTWPGSAPEARAVLEFVYSHPEIAMAVTYGSSNFCFSPPRTDRKGGNDLNRLKIPERIGRNFGVDTSRTYTYDEAKTAIQEALEGAVLSEARIAGWLGLKAEANPMPNDMVIYREISKQYKEFLEEKGIPAARISPAADKDGSFELLAYYHLGIPSFALDFWTPPVEKKDSGAGEDGDSSARPDKPERSGKQGAGNDDDPDVKDKKALLAYSDSVLEGRGFVEWKVFQHPILGEVEIGGPVPFTDNTPQPEKIEGLLSAQVPWTLELAGKLPRVSLAEVKVKNLGSGVSKIEAVVRNEGEIPYPIAMGARNGRILPVIVTLDNPGITVLEGKPRIQVYSVPAGGTAVAKWLVKTDSPQTVTVKSLTMNAWNDEKEISLGGAK